jgi:CrcB protein
VSPLLLLAVALGGGVGAGLRYLVDLGAAALFGARFPWGTLLINVTGSFALGMLSGAVAAAEVLAVIGTGVLGGYTTFSAVAVASALLVREGRVAASVLNAVGTLALTAAAAAGGLWVGGIVAG